MTIQNSLKKKIKYLGVNLRNNLNDLYKEKHKPSKKEGAKISNAQELAEST
jgi:hypothetical protein